MVNIIAEKATLARLSFSRWGGRVFDEAVANEVLDKKKANRNVGLFTKRLVSRSAMAEVNRIANAARDYHNYRTKPWLDDRTRILPNMICIEHLAKIGEFKGAFYGAVDEFIAAYPKYVKEAEREMGDLYDATDYPSVKGMRDRFSFDFILTPCPDSGDFRSTLDPDQMKEIKANLDHHMDSQLKAAMQDTGYQIREVVQHMAERLKAYKPGDKKKGTKTEGQFRDSLVENVRDLAGLLPAFNLNADPKLAELNQRIVDELCQHDADALREDDLIRKKVRVSADKILKDVSDFLA